MKAQGKEARVLTPDPSSMLTGWGPILKWFSKAFFGAVTFDETHRRTIQDSAGAGIPIYVLNVHSLLDYLYFNFAFLRYGLPLARFANGIHLGLFMPIRQLVSRIWGWLKQHKRDRHEVFRTCLYAGEPTFLFLKRGRSLIQWGGDFHLSYLQDVVEVQRESARSFVLIPMLIVWDPKPESYRPTFFDLIFGDPQAPGRLRKLLSFVRNFRRARVQVGRPVDVRQFITNNPDTNESGILAARLKFELSREFLVETKAIRGPILKGARRVIDEVMRTPPFIEDVRAVAGEQPVEVALSKARTMLKKMAADYRFGWIEAFALALGILFNRLFKGIVVDTAGISEIRNAARNGPIVLVPAHRSHMDYLIYSMVLYTHGLIPPHIAAGDNLSFWPMGPIFRHSGAFFIRRTIRDNTLYQVVLRHYIRKLLKEGYWIEFYIEGTRSRSGKAVSPKYGMLAMVVDAVASGAAPNAYLMPAAITYERVIEESSYKRESSGGEKERESLKGLAASAKVLGSRYGKVYVHFDHVIDLISYLKEQSVDVPLGANERVPREVVMRLAHLIMDRINRCLVVTPYHLVAFALLTHQKRGLEREKLLERVGFLVIFVAARGALLSDPVEEALAKADLVLAESTDRGLVGTESTPSAAVGWALRNEIDDVLRILKKEKVVRIKEYGDDFVIQVEDEGRQGLDYYKNGIIHLFMPEAMVATAVLRLNASGRLTTETLSDHVRTLSRLFKFEFVFGPGSRYEEALGVVLKRFIEEDLLRVDGERLIVPEDSLQTLEFFAGIITPFIEGYRILCRALLEHPSASGRELIRVALRLGRKMHSIGDISCLEAVSAVLFNNALESLESETKFSGSSDLLATARDMLDVIG